MRGRSLRAHWLIGVLVAAVAVRLAFVSATPGYLPVVHDDGGYDSLACAITESGAYPSYGNPPQPTAYRPPGYPFFLAGIYELTGCDVWRSPTTQSQWPRVINSVLGAFAAVFIAWLAGRWWGRAAGIAAGALAAVFAPFVVIGSSLLSESLFDATMLAAIVAAVLSRQARRPIAWAIVAGLAVGLCALTRANGVLLVPVLAAGVLGRPRLSLRSAAPGLALVLAAVVTIIPWTIRNSNAMHAFIPIADEAGVTIAGTYNDESRTDPDFPGSWRPPDSVARYREIFRTGRRQHLPETVLQSRLQESALDYATSHPGYPFAVAWQNSLRLLETTGRERLLDDARVLGFPGWPIRLSFVMTAVVGLLALLGLVTGSARRSPAFVWVAALLLTLSTVLVNAEALRFGVPLAPFAILAAGAGAALVVRRFSG